MTVTQPIWFLLCLGIATTAMGCYIRNCPFGKRSEFGLVKTNDDKARECPSCGPYGAGQCIGPNTCCTALGCFISPNSVETEPCKGEAVKADPCQLQGPLCGTSNDGICLADSDLCCREGRCYSDVKCQTQKFVQHKTLNAEEKQNVADLSMMPLQMKLQEKQR